MNILPDFKMKLLLKWLGITAILFFFTVAILGITIKIYKREILEAATSLLEESINGEIIIGNYDITLFHHFPEISVALYDIKLVGADSLDPHREFLRALKVDINVEPLLLFRRQIRINSIDIENGEVNIFRTSKGISNTNIFKKRSESPGENVLLELKSLRLTNVALTFVDSLKRKSLNLKFIKTENAVTSLDTSVFFQVRGTLGVTELVLDASKGKYLKDKEVVTDLNMQLIPAQHTLVFLPSTIQFNSTTLHLDGNFAVDGSGKLELNLQADHIDYHEGLTILADTLSRRLSRYNINAPIDLRVNIVQKQPATIPAVDVWFSFQHSLASTGKLEMQDLSLEGVFTNHVDSTVINDDKNSQLWFKSMQGTMNNLDVTGNAIINDLTDPELILQATFDTELRRLNAHLDTTKLILGEGHFTSNFSYVGKLNEYLDETKTKYEGTLEGEASIVNGQFNYKTRGLAVNNLNGTFAFTEKSFEIKRLGLRVNKSPLLIYGSITDFIPFFTTLKSTGKINLAISSPRLNTTGLLQPRKIKQSKAAKTKSRKKISDLVELISRKLEFDIRFQIKEFIHKDFKASNAHGTLILANDKLILKKASLEFGRGTVNLDLNASKIRENVSPLTLDASLRNVGVKDFFRAFRDFNQTTLREQHVDGALNMDIHLNSAISDGFEVLTSSLDGNAKFKIIDGRLTDFEPMQNLSNFLFKRRDFSDIQFGEISSNIALRGSSIDVQRMEVQSTALTMFISGQYDLYDSTNLSIQIPLSNLKKRDQNFAPENIGNDARAGASVFLRVHPDKDGNTRISYDPFRKFRRNK